MSKLLLCAALSIMFVVDAVNAKPQENEFIQSFAYSYVNAWTNAGPKIDSEFQQEVGPPRQYVSAYQLLITDLFGFQFQCVTSSVWAKEYDEEELQDECQAYLQTGAMRLAGPGDRFTPYSLATWEGTMVVRNVSRYFFEYNPNFYHQLRYGTEITHRIIFTLTNVVTGESSQIVRRFGEEDRYDGGPRWSQLIPGVYRINVTIESYFPSDPYYYGFENIQGGVFVTIRRAN